MNNESEMPHELSNAPVKLLGIADAIYSLSRSFLRVGNREIAAELLGYAEELYSIQDDVTKDTGRLVGDYCKAVSQSSFNVLQAALAGVKVGLESREGHE